MKQRLKVVGQGEGFSRVDPETGDTQALVFEWGIDMQLIELSVDPVAFILGELGPAVAAWVDLAKQR